MPSHGFESLGDVLKRLGLDRAAAQLADPTAPAPEADEAPACPACHGSGYLRRDVPITDPQFGRMAECFTCGTVQTRRMARIWASSQVPETMRGFTLDSYAARSGKHQLVADVRAAWADGSRWLLFVGSVGLGKTGLAISLLLEEIRAGRGGLYLVTPTFLSRIRATYTRAGDGEIDEMDVLASVIEAPLLVLDDLGKVALSPWGQEKLFTLVNERHLAGRRTIVTSNLDLHDPSGACRDRCGCLEAHLEPATWDRIRGMSDVFRLTGDSLRGQS